MALRLLIIGANGFIGSHLIDAILARTDWHVTALDQRSNYLEPHLDNPHFSLKVGDMTQEQVWLDTAIADCDVVLPLAAIATPKTYVTHPLRVFELDFEANLAIIKRCVALNTRVVFPSTSEVYGMCPDQAFDEYTSPCVTGPISKPRWIYSASKQLLDRVIAAYGQEQGFAYSLFRPFNWIGPRLDNLHNPEAGSSRVITHFMGQLLRGEAITIVGDGAQCRSMIDVRDGIDCLLKIIANENDVAHQAIFNIGHPGNEISIKALAEKLQQRFLAEPRLAANAAKSHITFTPAAQFYGEGYQDVDRRVPAIVQAHEKLGWQPQRSLDNAIDSLLDDLLQQLDAA